ncbi:hypothetical protein BDP27DRAFT_1372420 [Rhodocollybia butyracea]|uniref:Uncharacterized protein n=1 Tax=Rhodocollybia butyracea TaxID=206335 RepID=A0A9P5P8A6_9AGAR|nr:hypothetical protein BDP27DRAFT_1372420 [Rhodocollybia butyracea]
MLQPPAEEGSQKPEKPPPSGTMPIWGGGVRICVGRGVGRGDGWQGRSGKGRDWCRSTRSTVFAKFAFPGCTFDGKILVGFYADLTACAEVAETAEGELAVSWIDWSTSNNPGEAVDESELQEY